MKKLWLTYAWKDNEDNDVDHIIFELRNSGINVLYDRVQLLAGRRLWDQIDKNIRNPEISAWAIYVTENSLRSEPCQEELSYALDRALRTRGAEFPLIGLFNGEFDSQIIPSALSTRLCVNLHNNDWVQQINNSVNKTHNHDHKNILPFGFELHKKNNGYILEVWPRTGTWVPFLALVSENEEKFLTFVVPGPRGVTDNMAMVIAGEGKQKGYFGRVISNPINNSITAQIHLSGLPEWIRFGQQGTELHYISFTKTETLPPGVKAKPLN